MHLQDFLLEFSCSDIVAKKKEDMRLTYGYSQKEKCKELQEKISQQQIAQLVAGVQSYFKIMMQNFKD